MGVPKFFRWISERYPAISQLIAENRIPEFDCLYLDMNGIIHNCTHKDSDSPNFRMTEEAMFIAIFNYIEHLFSKIKPKKLMFMAIDGVAPRAKMNQQRARRFRTALDAEKAREKAIKEGLEMPKEPPFDSNCITPGTEFMAKLTQQLKYFISKKVSEDAEWQGVEVVLSGHEVPGEGEHKIMEYIRQAKSQPGYDPNIRHCLHSLDADLIMLGLLTHDPHFCLLREEVTFGRQNNNKSKELEHQNFYLMQLCIVREYLELEFQQLKEPGVLGFDFDLERIIDDFILMAFFVGNDFLPNLPNLHINEGALSLMFQTYKDILPAAGGYINENGSIHLDRLGNLLDGLSNVEFRFFEAENSDASWLKSKQRQDEEGLTKEKKKGKLILSTSQKEIYRGVKKWVNASSSAFQKVPYNLPATLTAADREFVKQLADNLHVEWKTIEDEQAQRHMQLLFRAVQEPEDAEEQDEEDDEAQHALFRVLKKYDNAQVLDVSPEQARAEMEKKYDEKFQAWKNQHYTGKFNWGLDNDPEMKKLTENYVQGLQWVLFYYYRGIASWPWFFRYHYAPMISDVRKGLGADLNFKLGQPFHPYEQLMGVLPDRSKTIVPVAYHELMTSKDSPIIDFYPRDFQLDMNGKKMEWEAVVKIPFIDEERLLAAMAPKNELLTPEEKARNEFGVTLKFSYSNEANYTYPSSLPGIFADIPNCHCIENIWELPTMEGLHLHMGLMDGVKLGAAALAGFPSLKTLPFVGGLAHHGVCVFQQESRNQSMVVTLLGTEVTTKVEATKKKLGAVVHVGYPFLQEAKIVKVSDELFDYVVDGNEVKAIEHSEREIKQWHQKAERIERTYSQRLGMVIGEVESLVHVEMLKGLRKTDNGDTIKEYGDVPGIEPDYAAQAVVDSVMSPDERYIERAALPVEQEFPVGSRAFFLGGIAYGRPLEIVSHANNKLEIWVSIAKSKDENWARAIAQHADRTTPYMPSYAVAKMLYLSPLALSKITSSFSVHSSGLRLNLGLNLKFEAKKQKVLGYSRRNEHGWEFSQKAINLIQQYMINFPEFIAGLQRNPSGNEYDDTDFYPKEIAQAKMKEIGQWLKSSEVKSLERVPLDANQLDSDTVKAIEAAADQRSTSMAPFESKKMKGVPRHALLKPADAEHRLSQQNFTVGDRIVYAQDSGKVPLALTGTVIGMTRTSRVTLLDIVFDATFMSGTTLGDRCSLFRGATVPAASVLNLTDRQVVAESRASAARQPAGGQTPIYAKGYGAPVGPNGQGQLFAAKAPPPLTNSFSGIAGGKTNGSNAGTKTLSHRGGRGRGTGSYPNGQTNGHHPATNKKGFTVIDNTDPTAGVVQRNPNFVPQSYAHVAPPAVLDAGRGGRGGRGSGRGRGNNTTRGARGGTRGGGGRGGTTTASVNVPSVS